MLQLIAWSEQQNFKILIPCWSITIIMAVNITYEHNTEWTVCKMIYLSKRHPQHMCCIIYDLCQFGYCEFRDKCNKQTLEVLCSYSLLRTSVNLTTEQRKKPAQWEGEEKSVDIEVTYWLRGVLGDSRSSVLQRTRQRHWFIRSNPWCWPQLSFVHGSCF